jgi:hypothetical protein
MKRLALYITVLATALSAARAQEDLPPPPFLDHGEFRPPPARHRGDRGGRGDRPGKRRPMEQWFDHLARQNPEEFQRLQELQREDPAAFRAEMATRLQRERLRENMRDMPRAREFVANLPPEEREQLLNRLAEAGLEPRLQGERKMSPELQKLQREAQHLVKAYGSADEAERSGIRMRLRENVGAQFDLREKRRADEVAKMAKRLKKLQQSLEQRGKRRDEIVEQRVRELTGTDTPAW